VNTIGFEERKPKEWRWWGSGTKQQRLYKTKNTARTIHMNALVSDYDMKSSSMTSSGPGEGRGIAAGEAAVRDGESRGEGEAIDSVV
jgi:hypothetical protein